MTKNDTMYYRIYYHTTSEDTMDIEMARKIFLENYFVFDYCSHEDLEEHYGVPVGKVKAFKEFYDTQSIGDENYNLMTYLVDEFKENVDDEEDEEEDTVKEEETTKEDTNVAEQTMKQHIENFVSNYLPDDEIEDNGVPKNKVSALKEYVVDELIARLEDMLDNEIKHIIKNEDEAENLFDKFIEKEEEDEEDEEDEHTCVICDKVINLDEDKWHDCEKCNMTCCSDCYIYRPEEIHGKSEFTCIKCDEEDIDRCYFTCECCSIEIEFLKVDYYNCNRCDCICCNDCYVYRPDIFGMKEMEDENGDCWRKCEVCTDCDEEFENADEEKQKEIIKDMKIKHDEPDTGDE